MKKFLLNTSVFFGSLLLISVLVVCFVFPKIKLCTWPYNGYYARCNSLTNACSRPRLVLVGGSNLACGIDNRLLSSLLDEKYELVNLGFHAGLGIGVHFDLIFDSLRAGDIVVLAAEYTNYGDRWSGGLPAVVFRCDVQNKNLFLSTIDTRWSSADCGLWRQYALEKFRKVVGGNQVFQEDKTTSSNDKSRLLPADNRPTIKKDQPAPGYAQQAVWSEGPFKLSKKSLRYLQELASEFNARRIAFLVSAPAFDRRHYALHPEVMDFYAQMGQIPNLTVISNPADYAFPLEEMLDTVWHVNHTGRKKRTTRLAQDIKEFLKTCPK